MLEENNPRNHWNLHMYKRFFQPRWLDEPELWPLKQFYQVQQYVNDPHRIQTQMGKTS
ncbi:hypothetical protein Hanom_Chr03g00229641 [Helianthus anomalus]